jgi:hypothetical protein
MKSWQTPWTLLDGTQAFDVQPLRQSATNTTVTTISIPRSDDPLNHTHHTIALAWTLVDPLPHVAPAHPAYYPHLGARALHLTQAGVVATVGGGRCVIDEYRASCALPSPRLVVWHVFSPFSRSRATSTTAAAATTTSEAAATTAAATASFNIGDGSVDCGLTESCLLVEPAVVEEDAARSPRRRTLVVTPADRAAWLAAAAAAEHDV